MDACDGVVHPFTRNLLAKPDDHHLVRAEREGWSEQRQAQRRGEV